MNRRVHNLHAKIALIVALAFVCATIMLPRPVPAQQALTHPEPIVAIHVSELTQALEAMPAASSTPTGPGTTGNEWWLAEWRYFVGPESLKEALRSDGTRFVEVSDADIASGKLLNPDGSPRYPIMFSLAAEAIDTAEIAPLRSYVNAGGMLFAGSSAFTRNPDGTTRGDFAFADDMGVHMVHPTLQNWYSNLHFTKSANHRLVADIPSGTLAWRMPISSEEIPLGIAPGHVIHGSHWVFQVYASSGTTVIANGDSGPLLAARQYGKGNFIYHGAMQPLVGHTIYDPSLYAYLIYRRAIEWAFEAAALPIIRLSPLRYDYDGAYVIRHDGENSADAIRAIESSAAYVKAAGGKSDFYFCTGTLRDEMADKDAVIASLRRAVLNSGATIGSHNGGLKNPVATLPISSLDYWHWGPDEALDITPPGYPSGKAYAEESLSLSFQDLEGWLAGLDNGRAGCGAAGNCPRIWAAPYMNSTRESSSEILESLNVRSLGTGEQKIGPFPHWGLSYQTPGKRFSFVSEPTSDWYVGSEIPGALEWGHTTETMRAAVDFYHAQGFPINLYSHQISSDSTLLGQYVKYCASKPRMWAANAVGIADWWRARSTVLVSPTASIIGNAVTSQATITGASDPETAVEVAIPQWSDPGVSNVQVFINDALADPGSFRITGNTIKVRVGASASNVKVQYTINSVDNVMQTWTQTDWIGGAGQIMWEDATLYNASSGIDAGIKGQIRLSSTSSLLLSDDFVRPGGAALSPWVASMGTWTVTGGILQGTGSASQYSYASITPTSTWTDYTLQGRVQLPALSFGGGLGGRVNAATGAHYGAWIYPAGSPGGSNLLKLWKFRSWTDIGAGVPMQQVSLADVGTGWHALQMTFIANRIQIYYDGVLKIDVTDNNYDSRAAYLSGGISADWWTWSPPYTIGIDDISVAGPTAYGSSGLLLSSAYDGGDSVQWQTVSWEAATGPNTSACIKTRTAGSSDQLDGAAWSNCYAASGSGFSGESRRWIQYQLELNTSDTSTSPVFNEIRTSYLAGSSGSPMPAVTSLNPTSATAGDSGFGLTVNGSGFVNNSMVQWNGAIRTTTYVSANQLIAAISAADLAAAGAASVTVFTPAPGGGSSNAQVFTIAVPPNPVPAVANLSPVSATAGGAAFTLTVNGTGFMNGSLVRWKGSNRTTTYVSANRVTAAIAAADIASAGTATVAVFNPAPGGGVSNAQTFTITAANNPLPTTTGLSPVSATAGGAAFTLTVNGTGFMNGSLVRWKGSNRSTTYVSANRVTAAIAAADIASAGTATVTVFNPAPGGGVSNAQTFTINAYTNPLPATTGLKPKSKKAGGAGFVLTVSGKNFNASSVVRWKGASRTTTYLSASQLNASILAADIASVGTATVTVFNPTPGGGTSNAQTFTITTN